MECCKEHTGHEQRIDNCEKTNDEQWKAINELRNRLPVWATVVISVLTFFLGGALTFAGLVSKGVTIG
jgi:hypothetical protein